MSPEIGKFSLTSHKLFQDGICCVMAPHYRIPGHGRHRDHREHPRLRRDLQVEQIQPLLLLLDDYRRKSCHLFRMLSNISFKTFKFDIKKKVFS